ncbi:MAG: RluA family pseudouridine synthase [Alphaproteobacteria bacterium]|nr:MAG: RluA family pseudouridine synthase [Alphaproteobacteria bacterium]
MPGSDRRLPVAHIPVAASEEGVRLDRWMRRRFPGLAPSAIAKMARTGQIRVDGRRVAPGARLAAGQVVRVPPLPADALRPPLREQRLQQRPLSRQEEAFAHSLVLYEDDWVIAIAKPPGLSTQGGPGIRRHVDRLAAALRRRSDEEMPRLVHRLDRETSGVLLLARTAEAAARLAASLRSRQAEKLYWAVVAGLPRPAEGEITAPLLRQPRPGGARVVVDPAGKKAHTRYQLVAQAGRRFSWVKLAPLTGRTHQLRVHLAHLGHPILGDRLYGTASARVPAGGLLRPGLHLHARRIRVPHPRDPDHLLDVRAPLPEHMRVLWEAFGWDPEEAAADEPPSG